MQGQSSCSRTQKPLSTSGPAGSPGSPFAHLCKGSSMSQSTLTPVTRVVQGLALVAALGEVPWGAPTAAHQLLPPSLTSPHCVLSLSTQGTAITHFAQAAALKRVGQAPHNACGTQDSSPVLPTDVQPLALFSGHIMAPTILQKIFPR